MIEIDKFKIEAVIKENDKFNIIKDFINFEI